MNKIYILKSFRFSIFLLGVLMSFQLSAQVRFPEFEVLNRGNLWETVNDDGRIGYVDPMSPFSSYPSMDWPGGPDELRAKTEQRSYQAGAGLWIGAQQDGTLMFTEHGPFSIVDAGTFEPIERRDNYIEYADFDSTMPEQTVFASWTTSTGIRVDLESHAWSYPGFNNFIIHDYVFTNETGGALTELFVGFPWLLRPSYQDLLVHNGWGDELNRMDDVVGYDSLRNMIYVYDEKMGEDIPWDWGNYLAEAREVRTPGYAGIALLYADAATDESIQPANVFWASILDYPGKFTQSGTTPAALYGLLDGSNTSMQHLGTDFITALTLMSCGPYDLSMGESVRIVLAEAVDGLPLEDLLDIDDDGTQLEIVQARLSEGLGMLATSVDSAAVLFNNDYISAAYPPPAPELTIVVVPNQGIDLTWEPVHTRWLSFDEVNRQTKSIYRIFRSDHSFNGPYAEILNKKVKYITEADFDQEFTLRDPDGSLFVGVEYYYAVTIENEDGQISWLTNRTQKPLRYGTLPAENTLSVSVFPNPFRVKSGLPSENDQQMITFTNLPDSCTLNIYTTDGKRVRSFIREGSLRGEEVWDQRSSTGIEVVSGIYFWTVEAKSGTATGTMLIIK